MASVWAIGDVHGKAGMLEALLEALPRTDDDTTVFLGDYIDRGEDSAGVVRRALAEYDAAPERTILLWGNHEDMAAAHFAIYAPSEFTYDPYDWFNNGGIAAMESWGHQKPQLFVTSCPPELARLFTLLRTYWRAPADLYPELANCIWVHAGLRKGQQPEDAGGDVLLWIRDEFLDAFDPSGRFVIHGHTPMRSVLAFEDKVGIDTGAVFGGSLTALQLPERHIYQVDAQGNVVDFPLPVSKT
jgi:serine/threonine protein phosphatase 1